MHFKPLIVRGPHGTVSLYSSRVSVHVQTHKHAHTCTYCRGHSDADVALLNSQLLLLWRTCIPHAAGSDSDVISSTVALHRTAVQRKAGRVYLVQEEEPARKCPISPEEGVVRTAAAVLMLASYRNQTVHVFVRPALLTTAIHVTKSTRRGEC